MKLVQQILGAAVILVALTGTPAAGQMGGGGMGGPTDGMTNGSEDLIIPAGVRGDGRNGAFFVTDVWIKAAATGQVTLAFHAADAATSTPATATLNLTQPVTYLPDVIQATFGLPAAFGNIRVTASFAVSAMARVYNRTGAGAYGLAFMGMPARMSMAAMPMSGSFGMDDFTMYMLGLLPQPGNRVNVNVVNTTATAVSGVVEIVDADGSVPAGSGPKTYPFSLAGFSSHQFNDVLADLRSRFPNGDAGLQVRVRLSQGSPGAIVAYAVVNDNLTNDGYVVMGSMMNGGRGMGAGMTGGGMGGGMTGSH